MDNIAVANPPEQVLDTPPAEVPQIPPASTEGLVKFEDFFGGLEEAIKPEDAKTKTEQLEPLSEIPPEASPAIPQPARQVEPRDLSDIPEADRPYFKAMSNEAFARMKQLYKEQQEIAAKYKEAEQTLKSKPKFLIEHPNAFVLDEEYQQASQAFRNYSAEASHWEAQYTKIAQGEDWEDIEQDKDGNLKVVSRPADAKASVRVLGYLTEARRLAGEHRYKAEAIKNNHTKTHTEVIGAIRHAENKFFPDMTDYSALIQANDSAKLMHTAMAELGQTNNPLSTILVKLYAAFVAERRKNQVPANPAKTAPAKPNQPTSKDMVGAPVATKPKSTVSFDDFKTS